MQLVSFERLTSRGRPVGPRRAALRPANQPPAQRMGDSALGLEALEPSRPGARRLGALLASGPRAGDVVDLNQSLAIKLAFEDVGAPEAEADSLVPADMLRFLQRGSRSMSAAREALDFAGASLDRYDAPDFARAGAVEPADRVRLCAPIARPGKIVGVVGNYAADPGPPGDPIFFLKAPTSIANPNAEIVLPADAGRVGCAGGLAIVIGRLVRGVSVAEALDCVAGYLAVQDLTWHLDTPDPAWIGKSSDTFCPIGPALVTADEIADPQALSIRTALSAQPQRASTTREMHWSVAEIVSRLSRVLTLEPGDIVLTGSPNERDPGRYLRDGDVAEIEIESVGRLANYVRAPRD